MGVRYTADETEPGGLTHVFRRDGAAWDVGVHYVGELGPGSQGRAYFDYLSGGRLHWNRMTDAFDRFVYPDLDFAVPSDPAAYERALVDAFPDEAAARSALERAVAALSTTIPCWPLTDCTTSAGTGSSTQSPSVAGFVPASRYTRSVSERIATSPRWAVSASIAASDATVNVSPIANAGNADVAIWPSPFRPAYPPGWSFADVTCSPVAATVTVPAVSS